MSYDVEAVNASRIINLYPFGLHKVHRHPVIPRTGQLYKSQSRKSFYRMKQKQTIAYHSLNLMEARPSQTGGNAHNGLFLQVLLYGKRQIAGVF